MAAYSNLSAIATLCAEQDTVTAALTILKEWDGTVSAFVIAPRVKPPEEGMQGIPVQMPPMAVQITTRDANNALIDGVRSTLRERFNKISEELRRLGVEDVPADVI